MSRQFSENTRVQIPALLHLTRLGYVYLRRDEVARQADKATGILRDIFERQMQRLNPSLFASETTNNQQFSLLDNLLQDIQSALNNDDLGRSFFNKYLHNLSGSLKLIDFDNFHNNTFHCTAEQTFQNSEYDPAFRPDITVFINGIPLVIIEVKKPNNKDGMKAEYSRMNQRLQESSFRRFFNLFQLLIVSNNQEYENDDPEHLIGAYYATHAKRHYRFNHFREELQSEYIDHIADIDHHIEDVIISDSKQLDSLKNDAEYQTNIDKNSPTNKIISGLLYPKRLQFLLLHGMVYVEEDGNGVKEIQKHIMRYPQLFAAKKTLQMLQNGKRKGVIWHTQGSGKTAFAFYCVNILTQYFAQQGIVPKFYFIVDRIDLANQAAREFGKRGLKTYKINSRQDLNADFKTNIATRSGEKEICIVNIQKFSEDTKQENISGYNTHIQRIFFIDEAHRSYNMAGSFLPNLYNADEQSIKIALTGTPIIIPSNRSGSLKNLDKVSTKQIFGDYIHKYYYNASIDDGYTLKLMREKIKTTYQETIQKNIQHISQELQIKKGEIKTEEIHQHPHYAQPLLDYVVEDLHNSRLILDNQSIGGMLVCVNNHQAALLYRLFLEKYQDNPQYSVQSAILVLDDSENITHSNKKQDIEDYKQGKIDLLIVNKMLLTGFDCPRLKKLYLDRKIKAHNLLQALTRVNRPYQDFRYGYIVDFANIEEEFNRTNQAYLLELKQAHQGFLDEDEEDVWNSIFISEDEIQQRLNEIENVLWEFDCNNLEKFRQQIDHEEKETLYQLRNILQSAKELWHFLRLKKDQDNLQKLDFHHLKDLFNIINDRILMLNVKENASCANIHAYLNLALENFIVHFDKNGKEELKILVEEGRETVKKTREMLDSNYTFDPEDPELVSLIEELRRLIEKQAQLEIDYSENEQKNINHQLDALYQKVKELNRKNAKLKDKYQGDEAFARVDKRIAEKPENTNSQFTDRKQRFDFLIAIKAQKDGILENNPLAPTNFAYFHRQIQQITTRQLKNTPTHQDLLNQPVIEFIARTITNEYQPKVA